jgi:hypothetical protein
VVDESPGQMEGEGWAESEELRDNKRGVQIIVQSESGVGYPKRAATPTLRHGHGLE